MDGTWLTDQKDYDKELFLREFAEMQKQGIKFVVASGNQYANLMTRFPEVLDKIYFVAENGALVAQGRQILHVDSLSDDIYQTLLKITTEYPYPAVVMGLVSAYVKKSSGRAYKQEMKKYKVGGQAVLGRQPSWSTPWLTERHGYDPTLLTLGGSHAYGTSTENSKSEAKRS